MQETMLRAWRARDSYAGLASVRSWVYRIATNVCLDMLTSAQRRARPMDLGPCSSPDDPLPEHAAETMWITPADDHRLLPANADPAQVALARESVRLAFVAALQFLPPRQRAVLILRDVLHWSAIEVADLLTSSAPSVNSALQRARATLAGRTGEPTDCREPDDAQQRELLERYVVAFVAYDVHTLVGLLRTDATLSMPPSPLWVRGPRQIGQWLCGRGGHCAGSRLVPVPANGTPAFAQWRQVGGVYMPWSINVVETRAGRILGLNFFLDVTRLWPHFGLPTNPDDLTETAGCRC